MIHVEKFDAGTYRKGYHYTYFVPSTINHPWHWFSHDLGELLERAAHKLGELNSFSRFVPNIEQFIQLHVTREAVVSSRIEGTQTNVEEALLPELEVRPERRDDWIEVNNYIQALNEAIARLEHLPLSGRLIRDAHRTLLQGARGEQKLPGEYRKSQNWIGGATLSDAVFIPPHHDLVPELMSDLEHWLHNEDIRVPALLRIAIAHYQFETIHPFLDGNGRIGRLMIPLYLVSKQLLDQPLLYLSAFFEGNKSLYYDNLTRVRTHHDMVQWLKYFLVGVEQTASKAVSTLQNVLQLKKNTEEHIHLHFGRRTGRALALFQHLLQHPVITVEGAAKHLEMSYKAANDLIDAMLKAGILNEVTGHSRNRVFVFQKYVQSFEV